MTQGHDCSFTFAFLTSNSTAPVQRPAEAVCLPNPPPCLFQVTVLCCLRAFWREKLKTKIWWGPRFILWHSGTAQKPELELFFVSLSAEKVTIRASMSLKSYYGNYHALWTPFSYWKESWASRNLGKSQYKPANFWQSVKKVNVPPRKVCSSFKNMGLDFHQV